MAQVDSQTVAETVAKLTSLGYTITEPKKYTLEEIARIKYKQGMYLATNGNKYYYRDDKLHRTGGPALEYVDGAKEYFQDGERHRTDGPAIEYVNWYNEYYQNGKLHRTNGPAVEWVSGYKEWWRDDERHRTDGPAIEYTDGRKRYYVNGKELSEQEFISASTNPSTSEVVPNISIVSTNDTHAVTISYHDKPVAVINIDV